MLARFSARLTEITQSPATALERGKAALQQAEEHQKNREFEQAQTSLYTARAALKHGIPAGKEAETRPLLAQVYQKQAELLQRQESVDVDAVRERYARALEYFANCTDSVSLTRKVEISAQLTELTQRPATALKRGKAALRQTEDHQKNLEFEQAQTSLYVAKAALEHGVPAGKEAEAQLLLAQFYQRQAELLQRQESVDVDAVRERYTHALKYFANCTDSVSLTRKVEISAQLTELMQPPATAFERGKAALQQVEEHQKNLEFEQAQTSLYVAKAALEHGIPAGKEAETRPLLAQVYQKQAELLQRQENVDVDAVREHYTHALKYFANCADSVSLTCRVEVFAQLAELIELTQPPATALERGKAALQQAEDHQRNLEFEQAQTSLYAAKAALEHGVRAGKEAETRPLLAQVYQKQAELLQRQESVDVDAVRERYARALEYFANCTDSVSLTRRVEISAQLTELTQRPATALKRGKAALQQAEEHQKNLEFEQAQRSLHTARAALEHGVPAGKEAEARPLLAQVYQKQAELLQRQENVDVDAVRERYTHALKYFANCTDSVSLTRKVEVSAQLSELTELTQPPATALERGKAAFQQAEDHQKNLEFEQAQRSLHTARAALKHGIHTGKEAEARPLLAQVYQKQAELLQRQENVDVDAVRERYTHALKYFANCTDSVSLTRRVEISAQLTELIQPPATALERGKAALQQAEEHQKNREVEQAQRSLHIARAALEHGVPTGKEAEARPLLAQVYQKQAELLQRQESVDMDAVRERYARALEYFVNCTDSISLTRKVEVQRRLGLLPDGPGIAQIARTLWEQSLQAPEVNETALINTQDLVNNPDVLDFLAEWVKQYPAFAAHLHAWVEASKAPSAPVTTGAANAITALVRAGVQFNGTDLRGIRVPGADLSFGVFDRAQLQDADLRHTSLYAIWLRQANLRGAKMEGVQFSELPLIQEEREVGACTYSPDRKTCAVGLYNGNIHVYNTLDWKKICTLTGHTDWVSSVVYSPNGEQIASGSWDNTVRLWDARSAALTAILKGHTSIVNSVAFSPNGGQIASGSDDHTVRVWDADSGKLTATLKGHTNYVNSVVYSPSGQQIASGSHDRTVRVWDAASGVLTATLKGHTNVVTSAVTSVVYSPDGKRIASGSDDHTVRLWNAASGGHIATFKGHTDRVSSVVYSPNGKQIASGSVDNTVRLWDAASRRLTATLTGHTKRVTSVVYSPNGQQIASGSWDNKVRLWDVRLAQPSRKVIGHTKRVSSVAYSPNGQQIASGSYDNTVRLWDAASGNLTATLTGQTWKVSSVVYSPNGQQVASGSFDYMVRLWNAISGNLTATLTGHTKRVSSVVYSPNGKQIASGSDDHTVRVWDADSGALTATLRGHTSIVSSVAYSPNGGQIASGSVDNTVRLWDTASGALAATLKGHTGEVTSVVYSPNGEQIASGSVDNTVQLWDAGSGAVAATLKGHTGEVTSVVYSPSGEQIASGSDDQTVRLWDVISGRCLAVIQGFSGNLNSLAWKVTSDSHYLVTGSGDKSVRVWKLIEAEGHYQARLCWSSTHAVLNATDASIQEVQGLSPGNTRLLEQSGTVGRSA